MRHPVAQIAPSGIGVEAKEVDRLVAGRMLFVTYTMRGDVIRIISARGAEPHEKRRYHEV